SPPGRSSALCSGRLPTAQPSLVGPPPTASEAQHMPGAPTAATPRHAVPLELPPLALKDAGGAPRQLSEWRGHPLVVNFWATWCEPCRREIPLLKTLPARGTP